MRATFLISAPQIPSCRKSLLEAYSDIYYKAWKAAAGPFLKKLGTTPARQHSFPIDR